MPLYHVKTHHLYGVMLFLFHLPVIISIARDMPVIVSGGPTSTGAAHLAAHAGHLRVGAGVVTLASPSLALAVNASHLTAVMLTRIDTAEDITSFLSDTRRNAITFGTWKWCKIGDMVKMPRSIGK